MLDTNDYVEKLASDLESRPRMVRPAEAFGMIGVPVSTGYLWISNGRLPKPCRIGARAVAWPSAQLADWLRASAPAQRAAA